MASCKACGRAASDAAVHCMICGAPLIILPKCSGCGHDLLPSQGACAYCGKAAPGSAPIPASVPVQASGAPAPEPVPLPPRRAPSEDRDEFDEPARKFWLAVRIGFYAIALGGLIAAMVHFRSSGAFWAVLSIVVWFVLAGRPLTRGRRFIRQSASFTRNYEIGTSTVVVHGALSMGLLAVSIIGWIVVYVLAFKGSFGSSKAAFIIGFFLFGGSLLTNYQYKATKAAVVDPDLEQHIEEFGYGIALIRQYYIWGMAAPFIHAAFRLFA